MVFRVTVCVRGEALSHTITPAADGEYVITTVVGEMTREFALQLPIEATAVAAPLGIRCFLWDVTQARNVESVLGNYKSANTDLDPIQSWTPCPSNPTTSSESPLLRA